MTAPKLMPTACGTDAGLTEEWRPIAAAPGYEVSTHGRGRGVARTVRYRDGRTFRYREHVLKPASNPDKGHMHVSLSGRSYNVHRLVLEAFVGLAPPGLVCRHLNSDPTDNRLSNLAWGTFSENNHDAVQNGTHKQAAQATCLRGHLLVLPNLAPARLRQGVRGCLACGRARSACRKARVNHGLDLDISAVADAKYAAIMTAGA